MEDPWNSDEVYDDIIYYIVVSSQDSGFRLEGLHRLHERDNHKV
jgi:hypothetical protein